VRSRARGASTKMIEKKQDFTSSLPCRYPRAGRMAPLPSQAEVHVNSVASAGVVCLGYLNQRNAEGLSRRGCTAPERGGGPPSRSEVILNWRQSVKVGAGGFLRGSFSRAYLLGG